MNTMDKKGHNQDRIIETVVIFMVCSICQGEIKKTKSIKLFNHHVCSLCIYSIGRIHVDNIFFDYYKDRIKELQRQKLKEIL
jgi:hypothetical protein